MNNNNLILTRFTAKTADHSRKKRGRRLIIRNQYEKNMDIYIIHVY